MSLPSPPTRKSPYKHTVHHHVRKTPKTKRTIKISDYRRGKGIRRDLPTRKGLAQQPLSARQNAKIPPYLGGSKSDAHKIDIRITYQNGKIDRFRAKARDYDEAVGIAVRQARFAPSVIQMSV